MNPLQGKLIWKTPKPFNLITNNPDPEKIRLEFPDLIFFKGAWYCAFREAQIHDIHPSGKGRVIRSIDGETWKTVAVLEWEGADVREPKFSITAEGALMINTLIYFTSENIAPNGQFFHLHKFEESISPRGGNSESWVTMQTVTWLSSDGVNWGSAYACPSAANTWLWSVKWHNGMGYSVGYGDVEWGKDEQGTLYRTRDGKSWRALRERLFPEGHVATEAPLAFAEDDTAYCLLRGERCDIAFFGVGKAPYYQEWKWKQPRMDWEGNGDARPITDVCRAVLGGPKLMRLTSGRLLGAGRTLGPERADGPWRVDPTDSHGREDGRVALFWVDADEAVFTKFIEMDGTSYPGIVEAEGMLWISYLVWWGDDPGIYLAKVKLPD